MRGTDKNPRLKTTRRRTFCLFPLVRRVMRVGSGMRNMTKSVTMFMAEERYQTGSTARHRPFIDGTMEARGRQARARMRTWTVAHKPMKMRVHLQAKSVRSPTKRRRY